MQQQCIDNLHSYQRTLKLSIIKGSQSYYMSRLQLFFLNCKVDAASLNFDISSTKPIIGSKILHLVKLRGQPLSQPIVKLYVSQLQHKRIPIPKYQSLQFHKYRRNNSKNKTSNLSVYDSVSKVIYNTCAEELKKLQFLENSFSVCETVPKMFALLMYINGNALQY